MRAVSRLPMPSLRVSRALPFLTCLACGPAQAQTDLNPLVLQLQERLNRLEARNAELERRLGDAPPAAAREQAIARRMEDVETEVLALRRQTKPLAAVEGISAEAGFTLVAQRALKGTTGNRPENALNYRADITASLPAGAVGDGEGTLFAHFRLGQGNGLGRLNPTLVSTPNTTAFQLTNGDDSAALLAEAWYQLDLPLGGERKHAWGRMEFTVGKMDPFVFFDQNSLADNEAEAFLNNAFVHNPLLDSGGDVGADAYGFTPGLRLAWFNEKDSPNRWGVSLGAFGAGNGASFSGSLGKPFLIAQAEYTGKTWRELDGAWRLYTWRNGSATPYANDQDARRESHAGWGLSVTQQVSEHVTMFSRYGQSTHGQVKFDRALTLGVQVSGATWGRSQDSLGLAQGWLRPSREFRTDAPGLDANADATADFGFTPSGAERLTELFYRWQLNDKVHLAPSLQWIARPGGDASARDITLLGLRAQITY